MVLTQLVKISFHFSIWLEITQGNMSLYFSWKVYYSEFSSVHELTLYLFLKGQEFSTGSNYTNRNLFLSQDKLHA
jgi:hypothetical protein